MGGRLVPAPTPPPPKQALVFLPQHSLCNLFGIAEDISQGCLQRLTAKSIVLSRNRTRLIRHQPYRLYTRLLSVLSNQPNSGRHPCPCFENATQVTHLTSYTIAGMNESNFKICVTSGCTSDTGKDFWEVAGDASSQRLDVCQRQISDTNLVRALGGPCH